MKLKQIQQEHGLLFQKFKNTPRQCFEPSCNETAINSHILQKNGVLSQIEEDKHVYLLSTNQITGDLAFKRIGVNNAFSFKGFCNYHDTAIFSPIEQDSFDAFDYKTQLLICYRGMLNEQRKKEVLVDLHRAILSSNKLKNYVDTTAVGRLITNEREAIKDYIELTNFIRQDLSSNENNFYFSCKIVEKLDICTSSSFNIETRAEMTRLSAKGVIKSRLNCLTVNILPYHGKTLIMIGCLNKSLGKCLKYFIDFNTNPIKFAGDILLKHIETWVCSPRFYLESIKPIEKEFLSEFKLYPTFKSYSESSKINIFKSIT
jgi:hypothetical protein